MTCSSVPTPSWWRRCASGAVPRWAPAPTLTKDAPPDALTVSRAKQMTLPGWARPQKVKK